MKINIEGFTPYPKQVEWINAIEDPEIKYATLIIARQTGKSLILTNLLLKWSLENNKTTSMMVSPTYNQVRKIFEDVEKVLSGTPLLVSSNKSNYEMTLMNGSKLIFRSAEKPDNLRGYTNHFLLIDEASFIRENVWSEILRPTILVHGRKVVFASTPKNKGNYLYQLDLMGKDPEKTEYVSIQGTSYDNPYINPKDLDEAKKTMPEDIYRAEVMGEWTDGGGEVFKDIDRYCVLNQFSPKQNGKRYYAGLDLGRMMDYTVLTILDDEGSVAFILRVNNKPWDIIIDEVVFHLKRFNASVYTEINGIGDALFEQLQKKYKNSYPFLTTNASKQSIIEELIYELNVEKLRLPTEQTFQPLYGELQNFTYSYSPTTRKVIYKAIDGSHDDCIMSLAIALHSYKQKKTKGSYYLN